jgi:signal transduction histidine kinase
VYVDLPGGDISLRADGSTAVFRILQEALTNVARHAGASEVHVRLAREDENVALEVRDNGRGIDRQPAAAAGSLGILGMRERAVLVGGTLTIEAGATRGTIVRVTVPSSEAPERQT